MSVTANISLHHLASASLRLHHVTDGGQIAVILDNSAQLHWDNLDDFEGFVDALHAGVLAAHDKAVAA